MPISNADYEISITGTVDLPGAHLEAAGAKAVPLPEQPSKVRPSAGKPPEADRESGQNPAADQTIDASSDGVEIPEADDSPATKLPRASRAAQAFPQARPDDHGHNARNRLDSAQSRLGNNAEEAEELQTVLDHAISLLEKLTSHPGIRDAGAVKARLERVEQQIQASQSGNT